MAGDAPVRRIATEEAFAIPEQFDRYRALAHSTWSSADVVFWGRILNGPASPLVDALLDVDERRLDDMDANGVDVQLLLLTSPGVQVFDADTATDLATLANDRLAEAIARHPDRFAGLATFAPQDPARAAKKMERAITERRNFLITTSGMNHHPPLRLCVDVLGAERVMWAIDYRYQQTPECVEFMDTAPLSDEDRAQIYAHNAERAFGIAAPAAAAS